MPRSVLAFGEILWDVMPDTSRLGGAPFNFAFRMHSLGEQVAFVSRLGRDFLGRKAHEKALGLDMDTSWIQWDETHPTGTVDVSFDEHGDPDYVINPGVAYDHIGMTNALTAEAGKADCVCFGTLIQRCDDSRGTLAGLLDQSTQALVVYDINLRKDCFTEEIIRQSLKRADVLKINDDEVRALVSMLGLGVDGLEQFPEAVSSAFGVSTCVITLGPRGVLGWSREEGSVYEPGHRIALVDSLGAGDSCTAGFIHARLAGAGLREACRFGNAAGACVAGKAGGTPAVGDSDIAALMEAPGDREVEPGLAHLMET